MKRCIALGAPETGDAQRCHCATYGDGYAGSVGSDLPPAGPSIIVRTVIAALLGAITAGVFLLFNNWRIRQADRREASVFLDAETRYLHRHYCSSLTVMTGTAFIPKKIERAKYRADELVSADVKILSKLSAQEAEAALFLDGLVRNTNVLLGEQARAKTKGDARLQAARMRVHHMVKEITKVRAQLKLAELAEPPAETASSATGLA